MVVQGSRKLWQTWQRVAVCLLVVNLLIALPGGFVSSVAADEGTPSSEVTEVEPTLEPTEEPEVVEPTETEVVPVETVLPTPTETFPPTPEPTARPINTDTIVPDADFTAITLQSGIDTTTMVSFTYQVTTLRTGTRLVVELRDDSGAPASGWTISIPLLGVDGAGTVSALESATLNAGESFALVIAIAPPADVTVAERVSLHVWSTGLPDDGSEENAVADAGALAGITVLPLPPTATTEPTAPATPVSAPSTLIASPVVVEAQVFEAAASDPIVNHNPIGTLNNGMTCANPSPEGLAIVQGGTAAFICNLNTIAGLNLPGLLALSPKINIIAPSNWSILVAGTSQTSGVDISLSSISVQLNNSTYIPISLESSCLVTSGIYTFTVLSQLSIGGIIGIQHYSSTVTVVVSGSQTPPSASVTSPVTFDSSEWTGNGYPEKDGLLSLRMDRPAPACSAASWHVTAKASAMTRDIDGDGHGDPGGEVIPAGAIFYNGTPLNTEHNVLSGASAVTTETNVSVGLRIKPPNVPPGTYTGTITVTSANGQ